MSSYKTLVVFSRPVGLFSLVTQVLGQIALCRKEDTLPIVYFNSQCVYWSALGHNQARNVWEYYFEPISDRAITDVVDADGADLEQAEIWEFSQRQVAKGTPRTVAEERVGRLRVHDGVVVSNEFPVGVIDWNWEMSSRRKQQLHRILEQYIRVKPAVAEKAAKFSAAHFEGNVLGVHIRGHERSRERLVFAPEGHVGLEHYVSEIDAYLARHPSSSIFCATDSQDALNRLQERYESKLISYPATRLSTSDEHLGLHLIDRPEHNRAANGEDVVVECLLLTHCNHLLHGPSNVTLTARLMNPRLTHLDVFRKYGYKFQKLRAPYVRHRIGPFLDRVDNRVGTQWRLPLRYAKRRLRQLRRQLPQ